MRIISLNWIQFRFLLGVWRLKSERVSYRTFWTEEELSGIWLVWVWSFDSGEGNIIIIVCVCLCAMGLSAMPSEWTTTTRKKNGQQNSATRRISLLLLRISHLAPISCHVAVPLYIQVCSNMSHLRIWFALYRIYKWEPVGVRIR